MVTQENGGGQPEVKTKVPGWAWGLIVILVALLAYAGTQMMSAQAKHDEVNRLLDAARTAQTEAEQKLSEVTTSLSAEVDKLKATLDETTAKLKDAEAEVEKYRKRVEELESQAQQ